MSGKNIKKLRMEYEISVQRLAAYMRIEQEELLGRQASVFRMRNSWSDLPSFFRLTAAN